MRSLDELTVRRLISETNGGRCSNYAVCWRWRIHRRGFSAGRYIPGHREMIHRPPFLSHAGAIPASGDLPSRHAGALAPAEHCARFPRYQVPQVARPSRLHQAAISQAALGEVAKLVIACQTFVKFGPRASLLAGWATLARGQVIFFRPPQLSSAEAVQR
jgi:hypothetical protein